ncbi:dTDP-glucose 4,6-dehydratase [Streptomyces sp. NPDC055085]
MEAVLVTGGAGFVGSHFVKRLLASDDIAAVTILDTLTYAGRTENLAGSIASPKLSFVRGNILDQRVVDEVVRGHDAIVHFAAESHVDRSFLDATAFLTTNVLGTHTLLDAARRHHLQKFVHVSTDEVYGPMPTGCATENFPLNATIPYAASKAASDLMALSAFRTDGVPVCVTRSSNQYGPNRPRLVQDTVAGLAAERGDFDWDACSGVLFEDHDVLMLFDDSLDGIEDAAGAVHQAMGMINLAPLDWYTAFYSERARDPHRGFRQL